MSLEGDSAPTDFEQKCQGNSTGKVQPFQQMVLNTRKPHQKKKKNKAQSLPHTVNKKSTHNRSQTEMSKVKLKHVRPETCTQMYIATFFITTTGSNTEQMFNR